MDPDSSLRLDLVISYLSEGDHVFNVHGNNFSFPDGLWPAPACIFIPFIFKSSLILTSYLLRGLLLFLVSSIVGVAVC